MNDTRAVERITHLLVQAHAAERMGSIATAAKLKQDVQNAVKQAHRDGNIPDPEGLTHDVTSNLVRDYSNHLPALLGLDEET